MLKTIR